MDHEGIDIGAVENLQGVSWQMLTIHGTANHAGTTPMHMRRDAAYAAARVVTYVHDRAACADNSAIATVGSLTLEPNLLTVVPSKACLMVDIRNPDTKEIEHEEEALRAFAAKLVDELGVEINVETVAFYEPTGLTEGFRQVI